MPSEAEKRMHNNPFRRENEIEQRSDENYYGSSDGNQGGNRQEVAKKS